MNKEEYKKSISDLRERIATINTEIRHVEESYIESNRQFNNGDRIKITSKRNIVRYAYVFKTKISYGDDLKIEAYKEKKDGTPSKVMDCIWSGEKIELA